MLYWCSESFGGSWKAYNTGCMTGNTLVNHILWDDVMVLCPCNTVLQQLLTMCSVYGEEHDIKYNASKNHREEMSKIFWLQFVQWVSVISLGWHCSSTGRACNPCKSLLQRSRFDCGPLLHVGASLFLFSCLSSAAQDVCTSNTLSCRFIMCTGGVKASVFRAYCIPLYTAHLWSSKHRMMTCEYDLIDLNGEMCVAAGV